MFKSLDIVLC